MRGSKINFEMTRTDWVLEIISVIALVIMFILVIVNYNSLPDVIPRHFNASGQPDGYSKKILIWSLPAVIFFIYFLLTFILRYPHRFKYPVELTDENAERQYRNAMMMLRILKTIIVLGFLYITYGTIEVALGRSSGLGIWSLPIFVVVVLGIVAVFMYRGFRLR